MTQENGREIYISIVGHFCGYKYSRKSIKSGFTKFYVFYFRGQRFINMNFLFYFGYTVHNMEFMQFESSQIVRNSQKILTKVPTEILVSVMLYFWC